MDPNDLIGPAGYGTQNVIPANENFPYTIVFENQPTATAPALVVQVTQQLSTNLDWSTFELGNFGFGSYVVQVPDGRRYYSTRIDATGTVGEYVDVTAGINLTTGVVTWTFSSVDPITGALPTAATAGFLVPNDSAGDGEGFITYNIQAKPGLTTGTTISAQATVTFDAGLPDASNLNTPQFTNTIDTGPPTSSVTSLPAESLPTFTVSWSGQSDPGGSGIASYTIYVSTNGGSYTWLTTTSGTSTSFTGTVGDTYSFYSVATDNVGNMQPVPTSAQASTLVVASTGIGSTVTPTLSWPLVTGSKVDSYTIWITDDTTGIYQTFTNEAGPTFTAPNPLTVGHNYTWWVGAVQGQTTTWSNGQNFSISLTPTGPSGATANAIPTFSWNAIAGVNNYTIYLYDKSTGAVTQYTNLPGPSASPTPALALGDNYTWWVGAVQGNKTTWSNGQTFTIAPSQSGPVGAIATVTPTFSWTNVTNAAVASYTVWITDQTVGTNQVFTGQAGPTFNLPSGTVLTAGHSYTWWIGAVQGQTTAWSSGQSFSIPLTASGPTGTITNALPTFSWNSIAGVTSYELWLTDETTGNTVTPTATGATFTPTQPLNVGDSYVWWVGAVQGKNIAWDSGQTFTITPTASGPSGTITNALPTFSWNGIAGVASYEVWLTDETTGKTVTDTATGATFTPTQPLNVGHSYIWWVGAVQGKNTTWDNGQTFTIAPTANGPSGASATVTPTFSWTPVTGANVVSYTVWITDQTNGVTQTFTGQAGPTFNLPSASGLTVGHNYTWWVGAVQGQTTTWSSGQSFSIPLTASGPSGIISNAVPTFTWNAVIGITSYTIWLTDQTTGVTTTYTNLPGPSAAPTPALALGDSYIWWVGAVEGNNTIWDAALKFDIVP